MAGTDKQTEDKEAKPSRLDEAKGVIERYVNDLREIIRKLRQKMNGGRFIGGLVPFPQCHLLAQPGSQAVSAFVLPLG
ncbi:hypothetical protein GGD61_007625 [Bradyrhizobium sp. SBR1B]|nr:hypothetical protein [Bradyrhizobium sp. SBR1B]